MTDFAGWFGHKSRRTAPHAKGAPWSKSTRGCARCPFYSLTTGSQTSLRLSGESIFGVR